MLTNTERKYFASQGVGARERVNFATRFVNHIALVSIQNWTPQRNYDIWGTPKQQWKRAWGRARQQIN